MLKCFIKKSPYCTHCVFRETFHMMPSHIVIINNLSLAMSSIFGLLAKQVRKIPGFFLCMKLKLSAAVRRPQSHPSNRMRRAQRCARSIISRCIFDWKRKIIEYSHFSLAPNLSTLNILIKFT